MTLLESLLGSSITSCLSEAVGTTPTPTPTPTPTRPFKLPIEFLPEKDICSIASNIVTDLELCTSASDTVPSMYECISNGSNGSNGSNSLYSKLSQSFTTNGDFLKEYQQIIAALANTPSSPTPPPVPISTPAFAKQWKSIQFNYRFEETYYFMEFEFLKYVNRSDSSLQILYMLNMLSPLLTLLSPLMVFISPFFMLKFLGNITTNVNITWSIYWAIVKHLVLDLAIVKVFTLSRNQSLKEIVTTIIYALLFVYTTYQNIVACSNFHRKMTEVYDFMNQLHIFGYSMRQRTQRYQHIVRHIPHVTHKPFMDTMEQMSSRLDNLLVNLDPIKSNWCWYKLDTIKQIGYTMRVFYELKKDAEWNELITYFIQLDQYMDFIEGVATKYKEGHINMADIETYDASNNKVVFVDNYYAPHIGGANTAPHVTAEGGANTAPVKNTITMGENMIISGPNASGKTTLMKSVLLNIIFTQQFGMGFYGVGSTLQPFKYIHSYLNIPDTSGRDSLFQAEARRCKEILDKIKANPKESHFVIFDELFSGTNPEEAVKSSTAFVKYLATKTPNATFMLTTHYKKVCQYFKGRVATKIRPWRMKVNIAENKIIYTYKIEEGISSIKGGAYVLKDMGYPQDLLDSMGGA